MGHRHFASTTCEIDLDTKGSKVDRLMLEDASVKNVPCHEYGVTADETAGDMSPRHTHLLHVYVRAPFMSKFEGMRHFVKTPKNRSAMKETSYASSGRAAEQSVVDTHSS